jgi:hypothetical protein
MIDSDEQKNLVNALWLTLSLYISWGLLGGLLVVPPRMNNFWTARAHELRLSHRELIATTARVSPSMQMSAIIRGIISVEDVLAMEDGLLSLLQIQPIDIFGASRHSHLLIAFYSLAKSNSPYDVSTFALVGQMISSQRQTPLIHGKTDFFCGFFPNDPITPETAPLELSADAYLGAAIVLLTCIENGTESTVTEFISIAAKRTDQFSDLYGYIERRHFRKPETKTIAPTLPYLPVPEEFRQVFRDWAEGKVNFIGPAPDSLGADSSRAE